MNKNIAEGVPTTTSNIMDIIPKLCVSFHVLVWVVKTLTDGTNNTIPEEIDLPIVQHTKEFVEHLEEQRDSIIAPLKSTDKKNPYEIRWRKTLSQWKIPRGVIDV